MVSGSRGEERGRSVSVFMERGEWDVQEEGGHVRTRGGRGSWEVCSWRRRMCSWMSGEEGSWEVSMGGRFMACGVFIRGEDGRGCGGVSSWRGMEEGLDGVWR